MAYFSWATAITFGVGGMVLGLLMFGLWSRRQARMRRRIPAQWPLASRGLLTANEHEIWHWLQRAFYDHHITVKTPLSRFTRPRDKTQGHAWFDLLNGIYCTFSVTTADGTIIGCVDVPGKGGLLRSHRDMKESILTACGIAYAVVRANNLPTLENMRAAFLGVVDLTVAEEEPQELVAIDVTDEFAQELVAFAKTRKPPLAAAQNNLSSKLEYARRKRSPGFNPLITHTGIIDDAATPGWEDSFLGSSDSRPARL